MSTTHGASGKLLVDYTLLEQLSTGLGNAANSLNTGMDHPGAITGSADVEHAINHLADTCVQLRTHLQQTLQHTGEQTQQTAADYRQTDQILATTN